MAGRDLRNWFQGETIRGWLNTERDSSVMAISDLNKGRNMAEWEDIILQSSPEYLLGTKLKGDKSLIVCVSTTHVLVGTIIWQHWLRPTVTYIFVAEDFV